MAEFLKTIQGSVWMTVLSRLLMPLLAAGVLWAGTQILSAKETLVVNEVRRQADVDMLRALIDAKVALLGQRMEAGERRDDAAAEALRQMQGSVVEMRTMMAAMASDGRATRESIDRLNRLMESGGLMRRPTGLPEAGGNERARP